MKKWLATVFLILGIVSCQKEELHIANLNNNSIAVMGHGGMGISDIYPIDSFEGIMNCLAVGADGSEMDVQMTRDSILIAFHDEYLDHKTTLGGLVHQKTWREIQETWYKLPVYSRYTVTSLDRLFAAAGDLSNRRFAFDCKLHPDSSGSGDYLHTYARALERIISRYGLQGKVIIESKSTGFLQILKSRGLDERLFISETQYERAFEIAGNYELDGISVDCGGITAGQVAEAHRNNLLVTIWNTRTEKDNREAARKSPDFIQTDRVRHLLKFLGKE